MTIPLLNHSIVNKTRYKLSNVFNTASNVLNTALKMHSTILIDKKLQ